MSQFSTTIPGYELIRELGSGGMATVYLAIQRSLARKVAQKVMKRNIDDVEKFEKRFLVEGRTMAKLPHRNIVSVYDIVKSDDATYIAMEYLEGGTLSQKMKEGLSLGDAISVVVQIAQALQFAHEHGVVHRDLKPANIMYRDAHTPVLTDFGIAKQQDASATRLTQTGMLVGTPTYMSPEQINALEVDGRSDLYALGVLFYELLTGTPPFAGDTPIAVLMAHLTQPPPPLPAQFVDFQPVLDRMLAKNRDERFASLKEFTRALKGAVVNNQMLWQRLQADPDQSSSEQLRALGFSISGGGDSLQVPMSQQVRLPPSGRPGVRTPTPGPAPALPPSGQVPAPQAARRPPWIAIGAALAIVVVLGLGALALWPGGGLDSDVQRRADLAIAGVRDAVKTGDLDKARGLLDLVPPEASDYDGTLAVRREVLAAYKTRRPGSGATSAPTARSISSTRRARCRRTIPASSSATTPCSRACCARATMRSPAATPPAPRRWCARPKRCSPTSRPGSCSRPRPTTRPRSPRSARVWARCWPRWTRRSGPAGWMRRRATMRRRRWPRRARWRRMIATSRRAPMRWRRPCCAAARPRWRPTAPRRR